MGTKRKQEGLTVGELIQILSKEDNNKRVQILSIKGERHDLLRVYGGMEVTLCDWKVQY